MVGELDRDGHTMEDLDGARSEQVEGVGNRGGVGASGEEELGAAEEGSGEAIVAAAAGTAVGAAAEPTFPKSTPELVPRSRPTGKALHHPIEIDEMWMKFISDNTEMRMDLESIGLERLSMRKKKITAHTYVKGFVPTTSILPK